MKRKLCNLWIMMWCIPYPFRKLYAPSMTWNEVLTHPRVAVLMAYTCQMHVLDWPPGLVSHINQWRFSDSKNLYACMVEWFDLKVVR